jgi:hypothetical protein
VKTRARADKSETRELPTAIGSARVTAFGVSNVAPSGVAGGLVIVVDTRGPRLRCNSHGLGGAEGFLTGWMMVFAYALYVPAAIALTSAYASQLLAGAVHVTIVGWALFVVILAAVAGVAHLASALHPGVDLALVTGEMAVIAALAVSVLVKVGLAAGL